jgi:uncharacterized protein (TIGR02594 family)
MIRESRIEQAPPWLVIALAEHGVRETPGPRCTPSIERYHRSTAAGMPPQGDETSWCSSFVNWDMLQAGIPGTRSKAAISWVTWGIALAMPRLGCVAIYDRFDARNPNAAHVALWLARVADTDIVLGGNQGNAVSIAPYAAARARAYRWPAGVP